MKMYIGKVDARMLCLVNTISISQQALLLQSVEFLLRTCYRLLILNNLARNIFCTQRMPGTRYIRYAPVSPFALCRVIV